MSPAEIRAELERRDMKVRELAAAVGMNENYLTKSLKGLRNFRVEEMDAIRRHLGQPIAHEPLRSIPLLGKVPAGRPQPAREHRGRWHAVSDPETPPNAYALQVEGDSMDLLVPDGATLIIDPDDKQLWPGDCYIVRTGEGDATFKEFQSDPARLVPCSSNPAHKEIMLGSEPIEILGKVWAYTTRLRPRRAS